MLGEMANKLGKDLCPQGIYILVERHKFTQKLKISEENRLMKKSKEGRDYFWFGPGRKGTGWAKTPEQEEPEGRLMWHHCGE